ncbi:MAG: MFS transporter [Pseudomonadota bacterium]
MRAALMPLTIVMLPQVALSAVQMGLPVLAPALVADLGLAPEMIGPIGGCIGLGSVWMFAANHSVTPVLGPVRALGLAGLLAVIGVMFAVSGWLPGVLLGAVFIGFAYAVTAPAGSQILSDHVPRAFWGTVFSIRQAGVPLGGAIAGVLGAGVAVAHGWQAGLLCLALLPGFCIALPYLVPQSFVGGQSTDTFRLSGLFQPSILARPFGTLRALPQLNALVLASLGFACVQGSVFAFFTTYMIDGLGLGLAWAGTLFAVMQIASFTGRIGAGFVADHIGSLRKVLLGMSLAAAAACLILSLLQPGLSIPVLIGVAIFAGATAATWNGLFLAEIARCVPQDQVSTATAGVTFFTFVAYMLTPPVFALVVYLFGYQIGYCMSACAALFSFVCLRRVSVVRIT